MDVSSFSMYGLLVALFFALIWIWNSINVLKEWERGVVLRLGRMLPNAKGPGLCLVFYPIETLTRVSLRIETLDVPSQDIITRDNVSVKVNAVAYFAVVDANLAVSRVQNYIYATAQKAQTTLRSIVGQFELDEILAEREKVNSKLQVILDQDTEPWGIKVTKVEVKQVDIPEQMQRAIARQGEAARGHPASLSADADRNRGGEEYDHCISTADRHHQCVGETTHAGEIMAGRKGGGGDMVLGGRHLIGIFFLLVMVLGVVFTLGYLLGRSQYDVQLNPSVEAAIRKVDEFAGKTEKTAPASKRPAADDSGGTA